MSLILFSFIYIIFIFGLVYGTPYVLKSYKQYKMNIFYKDWEHNEYVEKTHNYNVRIINLSEHFTKYEKINGGFISVMSKEDFYKHFSKIR